MGEVAGVGDGDEHWGRQLFESVEFYAGIFIDESPATGTDVRHLVD